MHLIF